MRFKRLQHVSVNIEAGREDEARRFYSQMLGLREIRRPMSLKGRALIWYSIGEDDEIHLIRTPPGEFDPPRRGDHVCIEVDDIDALRADLREKNIDIREATLIDNRPRFFISDPFGNSIEVAQIDGHFTPVDEEIG